MNVPHELELTKVVKSMGYDAMPHLPGCEAKKIPPPALHFYDIFVFGKYSRNYVLSVTEKYIRAQLTDNRQYRHRKRFKYADYGSIYDLVEAAMVYMDKVALESMWVKLGNVKNAVATVGGCNYIISGKNAGRSTIPAAAMICRIYTK